MTSGTTGHPSSFEILDKKAGSRPVPGAVFFAPVLYRASFEALIRMKPDDQGNVAYVGTGKNKVPDFEFFSGKKQPVAPFDLDPYVPAGSLNSREEMVTVVAKRRPVIIVSPEGANQPQGKYPAQALAIPSFRLKAGGHFTEEEVEQIKRNEPPAYFFLPADAAAGFQDSYLDIHRMQPIAIPPAEPGMWIPRPKKPYQATEYDISYCRLAPHALEALKQKVADYLFMAPAK